MDIYCINRYFGGITMKNLSVWQLGGYAFAMALGTLLHFLLSWTNSLFFAPVSAVNESTWEHMKILFFPMLFFACIQSVFFRYEYEGFWWIKLIGITIGVLGIPVLFYTCNGAFGKSPDWLNILFFFISAGVAYLVEGFLFQRKLSFPLQWIAVVILIVLGALFILLTYFPPELPLFQDPLTGFYGLQAFQPIQSP